MRVYGRSATEVCTPQPPHEGVGPHASLVRSRASILRTWPGERDRALDKGQSIEFAALSLSDLGIVTNYRCAIFLY